MKVGGRCHEVEMREEVDQDWVKRKGIECPTSGQGGWCSVRGNRQLVACTIRNSHRGLEAGAGSCGRQALHSGLPDVWCLDVSGLELPLYLSRKQLQKRKQLLKLQER